MIYSFFIILALYVCFRYLIRQVYNKRQYSLILKFYLLALFFAFIGSKLLGFFVMLYRGQLYSIENIVLYGDMVYFGGLYGAVLGGKWLLANWFKQLQRYQKYIISSIPLFHSIARIGCFFSGCCYGKMICGIRFPVQLVESMIEMLIFLIISKKSKDRQLVLYIEMYSIARFFLEFLRGDELRGIVVVFSISQLICIVNVFFASFCIKKSRYYK